MSIGLPAGLHFIERNWLSSNLILGIADGQATLVDTGYAKHAPMTVALIENRLAASNARLTEIVNTHLHSDHCGANSALSQRFGATIVVPHASLDDVRNWNADALSHDATAQRCERFSADRTIAPGETFAMARLQWRAYPATGHDSKSLIYFCPDERILISADALWERGFGVLFGEIEGDDGFGGQRRVLDQIEALGPRIVLPGHGPAFEDLEPALSRARSLLDSLQADRSKLARHTLKVLVSYLMLDRERERAARLIDDLSAARIPQCAAQWLGLDARAALERALDELVAQQALERDGEWILSPH